MIIGPGEVDVNSITWGCGTLRFHYDDGRMEKSDDMEVNLLEMHKHCTGYLKQHEDRCSELLMDILSRLPVITDNHEYKANTAFATAPQ